MKKTSKTIKQATPFGNSHRRPSPPTHPNQFSDNSDIPRGSFKRMPLLTADELSFFNTLSKAIDNNYAIFTKIPLENIIHPTSTMDKRFLLAKEIDYLICDKSTSLPRCVIDVESTELHPELNYLLNTSGIAVVRLDENITAEELQKRIREAKPTTDIRYPQEVHDVVVTLVDNQRPQHEPKKEFPVITHVPMEKTFKQKCVTIGHWMVWTLFTMVATYTLLKIMLSK